MSEKTHDELFAEAVQAHQLALELYGEDDERTLGALYLVMTLAPDALFAEVESLAHATIH